MNGPLVIGICLVLSMLLTFIFIVGDAELDELRVKWEADRQWREDQRRRRRQADALSDTFPRVMR